jgi:lipoate-protein ligase B
MLSTKFRFIWPCGFRGEDLKKLANQKQESSVAAMFVNLLCGSFLCFSCFKQSLGGSIF